MAQGSYFKNWSSIQLKPTTLSSKYDNNKPETLFGQVLDVYYTIPKGLDIVPGTIRVKVYNVNDKLTEDSIITPAYPIDINIIKYPLPGELVLLTVGLKDDHVNGHITKAYYYTSVLSTAGSISFNSNPYYLNYIPKQKTNLGATLADWFGQDPETRFEKKLVDVSRFIKKRKVIERPILKPYEGDFIIQSRFGSNLRLGSTSLTESNQWSEFGGMAGSPITIFSLQTQIQKLPEDIVPTISDVATSILAGDSESLFGSPLLQEDINDDAATIALCSKQQMGVIVAVSKDLKSFQYSYNMKPSIGIIPSSSAEPTFIPPTWQDPPPNIMQGPAGIDNNVGVGEPYNGAGAPGGCITPMQDASVTSNWYRAGGAFHGALDIVSYTNKSLFAVADGIVIATIWDRQSTPCPDASVSTECGGGFGNYIIIYHPQLDLYSLYGHGRDLPLVKTGQRVTQGQQIGIMGNTGHSQGAHLHFELKVPISKGQANKPGMSDEQIKSIALKNHSYNQKYKLDIIRATPFYKLLTPSGPVGRERGSIVINTATV